MKVNLNLILPLTASIGRYVATELATDITVNVGDVKFYLHKVCTVYIILWACHTYSDTKFVSLKPIQLQELYAPGPQVLAADVITFIICYALYL